MIDHPAEIATYLRVSLRKTKYVIELIKRVDPIGVASQDVMECLLIQLDMLEQDGKTHSLAHSLLTDYWDQLGKRYFDTIARKCNVSVQTVSSAAQFIKRNLSPYPAQSHWNNAANATGRYFRPDVEVIKNPHKQDGPLVVQVFSAAQGWLRVNSSVRSLSLIHI